MDWSPSITRIPTQGDMKFSLYNNYIDLFVGVDTKIFLKEIEHFHFMTNAVTLSHHSTLVPDHN